MFLKLVRKLKLVRIADYIALLICISVFVSMLPGFSDVIPYTHILFYLAIPGYAFTRVFFFQALVEEKFLALIAFSIALSAFFKVLTNILLRWTAVPSIAILSLLSMLMLGLAIVKDRPKYG